MSKLQVRLVNTGTFRYHLGKPPEMKGSSLGLKTIQAALNARGVDDVLLLPESTPDAMTNSRDLIIGLSVMSDNWTRFTKVSEYFRQQFPDALIVGGGPHFGRGRGFDEVFNSAGVRIKDSVELALEQKHVDAVVVGHMEPFIKLVTERDGSLPDVSARGFYYLDDSGQIVGKGLGRYPQMTEIPISFSGNEADLVIDSTCKNNCGFCCVNNGSLGFSQQMVQAALERIEKHFQYQPYGVINLYDSNPFQSKKSFPFLEVLEEQAQNRNSVTLFKITYVDPSVLLDKGAAKFAARLAQAGFIRFFFGRDTVAADIAQKIGVNDYGKPKNQAQLDNEKRALIDFINFLKMLRPSYGGLNFTNFRVDVAYIITPFETQDSLLAIFQEIEMFANLSGPGVVVEPLFNVLTPYPGTAVRKNFIDHIVGPEDFSSLSMESNTWSRDLGPAVGFLEMFGSGQIDDMYGEFGAAKFVQEMQKRVKDLFAG